MADSKRLQILKALTAHLEGVTGYDLTDKVWRGRNRPADESYTPYLILFEMPPEEEARVGTSMSKMPWLIGVQGYIDAENPHLTDPAHNFMAAVKERIGELLNDGGASMPPPEFMLNGLVEDIEVDGGMVFAPDETTKACFFAMKLTLTIVENLENPYG